MSCVSDFYRKIADKDWFKTGLLSFFDQVIKYKLTFMDINKILFKVEPSILAAKNVSIFTS